MYFTAGCELVVVNAVRYIAIKVNCQKCYVLECLLWPCVSLLLKHYWYKFDLNWAVSH